MARYTSLFTVAVSFDRLRQMLTDILCSCRMNIIYSTEDYLVAREVYSSGVSYPKLVTVEVLIDRFSTETEVRMSFVVKNEELPLQNNNHCRDMFNRVNQAIVDNRQWHLINSAAS